MSMCLRASGGSVEGLGDNGDTVSGDNLNGWDPLRGAKAPGTSSELLSDRAVTYSKSDSGRRSVNYISSNRNVIC